MALAGACLSAGFHNHEKGPYAFAEARHEAEQAILFAPATRGTLVALARTADLRRYAAGWDSLVRNARYSTRPPRAVHANVRIQFVATSILCGFSAKPAESSPCRGI